MELILWKNEVSWDLGLRCVSEGGMFNIATAELAQE